MPLYPRFFLFPSSFFFWIRNKVCHRGFSVREAVTELQVYTRSCGGSPLRSRCFVLLYLYILDGSLNENFLRSSNGSALWRET